MVGGDVGGASGRKCGLGGWSVGAPVSLAACGFVRRWCVNGSRLALRYHSSIDVSDGKLQSLDCVTFKVIQLLCHSAQMLRDALGDLRLPKSLSLAWQR